MNTQPMFMMPMPSDIAAKAERYKAANGVPLDAIVLSILRYVLDAETAVKSVAADVPLWEQADPDEPPLTEDEISAMDQAHENFMRGDYIMLNDLDAFLAVEGSNVVNSI